MKQYVVDAFADRVFEGNPAAVCLPESWPSEEQMMAITRENNLSETAFAVREGEDWRLRWFTPGGEIDLCGHATLAAAYAISRFVDPDAEDKGEQGDSAGGKVQFLFKLDLESLGFLEITLAARDEQVDLHIYGPENVSSHDAIIAEDMAKILARHQLTGSRIQVSKLETPLTLTQVFPTLFEGKRGVNVKV